MRSAILPIILLLSLVRVWLAQVPEAMEVANYYPLTAMAFIGSLTIPGKRAWIFPAIILFLSDLGVNYVHQTELLSSWSLVAAASYMLVAFTGSKLKDRDNWKTIIFGSIVGALVFYLIANTYAWATLPAYPKTLWGWIQSQTYGLAGFPPSYLFLKNMIGGNGLFAAGIAAIKKLKELKSQTLAKANR
jgi:hypothetical protein